MLEPVLDYLLCEEVKVDQGVVTGTDVGDHWQKYKVLAMGPGRPEPVSGGGFQVPPAVCKVGDTIYVQKHAEADTPPELKKINQALIMASRVMGVANEQ